MISSWTKLLGQNVVKLEDPNAICDLIVSLIAENEGVELDKIESDLSEFGSDSRAISLVSKEVKKRGGKEVAIAGSGAGSNVVRF